MCTNKYVELTKINYLHKNNLKKKRTVLMYVPKKT